MGQQLRTQRGYDFYEVASALQKDIRRARARMAAYWAIELYDSGYRQFAWNRLLIMTAEDCFGVITTEIEALYRTWHIVTKGKEEGNRGPGRLFVAKAAWLLAECRKSREIDHLLNLPAVSEEEIKTTLGEITEADRAEIPEYALDVHTLRGKRNGKTKEQFIKEEFAALKPRVPGECDQLVLNFA